MARTLTLGAFRINVGAESPWESWEETHEETEYTAFTNAVRFQGDANAADVTVTVADLIGSDVGTVTFVYLKNHDSSNPIDITINDSGGAKVAVEVAASGIYMHKGPLASGNAITTIVLGPGVNTIKYTLIIGDE